MTAILGVSCFFHDAAAAVLVDGVLVAAAEEERFTRRKHDPGFPAHAIEFCLVEAGLSASELDYVVFYEKPLVKLRRIVATILATAPRSRRVFMRAASAWLHDRLWIRSTLSSRVGVPPDKILFVDHHLSHAASALFCSPFEDAAIVTVDGVGEWTTAAIGRGHGDWTAGESSIELEHAISFPHSLGLLYSAFTAYLGFEVNEGEYKVMGMAGYGEPRFCNEVRKLIHVYDDGSFWLDLDYFSFESLEQPFNQRFEQLFGEPPRDPSAEFKTKQTHPGEEGPELERGQFYADVAASVQAVTESVVIGLAAEAHRRTGLTDLCLAGGVALNGLANRKLLEQTPFKRLFIPPAPGDSGGALGCALYAEHVLLGRPRRFVLEHAFWGKSFTDAETIEVLDHSAVAYELVDDQAALCSRIAADLAAGRVVGWFQGRFEWGPRALGNRSILADPRDPRMKAIVNEKIKFREPFRPFSPAVLEEDAGEFVDPKLAKQFPSRFMLLVVPLRESHGAKVPATDHMGTARVQTVRREWNPRYHELIRCFGEATGVPALLNTSFNLRGEPIVSTPADALSTFQRSGLDVLVLGNVIVEKR